MKPDGKGDLRGLVAELSERRRLESDALADELGYPCPDCGLTFETAGGCGSHRYYKHGIAAPRDKSEELRAWQRAAVNLAHKLIVSGAVSGDLRSVLTDALRGV